MVQSNKISKVPVPKETPFISDYIMEDNLKLRSIYAEVDAENASPNSIFNLPKNHIARQEAMSVCDFIYNKVEQ